MFVRGIREMAGMVVSTAPERRYNELRRRFCRERGRGVVRFLWLGVGGGGGGPGVVVVV